MKIDETFQERREKQRVKEIERGCDLSLEYMRYCDRCRMEMLEPMPLKMWMEDRP